MDTEEHIKIQEAIQRGQPHTDEGPYYHDSWWESYKGGIKGYLGGAIAYAGVGAAIGLATAGVLALMSFAVAAIPIITGFSAVGLLYGAHEFNNIGKIVGSGAAIAEKQEERSNSKFAALERKIDELKTMVSVKNAAPSESPAEKDPDISHRTKHISDSAKGGPWIFWKVAAVGLFTGLAAGALLGFGGTAEHLLKLLGTAAADPLIQAGNVAIITAAGLFGASFGINRDIFRRIFDKTDLLFKGLFTQDRGRTAQPGQLFEKSEEKSPAPPIVTVVYPDMADYPASDTHHRDKLTAAKLALLNLDPAKTIRQ